MSASMPQHPAALLGAAVRLQRQRLGLQQKLLADLAGVGVAFLYDLERGKPTLRLDKVLAVLRVLGLGLTVGRSDSLVSVAFDGALGDGPLGDGAPGDGAVSRDEDGR